MIKVIRWIIGIFFGLIALSIVVFWGLFYWDFTANLPFVIILRGWYQDTYWQVESMYKTPAQTYPIFDPIYTLSVQGLDINNDFYYVFWGRMNKIDIQGNLFYLTGLDGKNYVFKITQDLIDNQDPSIFVRQPRQFNQLGLIKVLWPDPRSLYQIYSQFRSSPQTPVNNDASTTTVSSDITRMGPSILPTQ